MATLGLHLCYELGMDPATCESAVVSILTALRERALARPFAEVSDLVRFTESDLAARRPLRGHAFVQLVDVAQLAAVAAREVLYCRQLGHGEEDCFTRFIGVPPHIQTLATGFAVQPGPGSESAAFALVQTRDAGGAPSRWWCHQYCKTQYASIVSDENLVTCHGSLVTLLDAARDLGVDVVVHDETGFWESRSPVQLVESVTRMNQLVARVAGRLSDTMDDAGIEGQQMQAAIFDHPDFERLEMGGS